MAGIMTLPNDLLILVFIASPTVQDAGRLAGVNRKLYDVWLGHSTYIVRHILQSGIPAYEDAIALAMTEAHFLPPAPSGPSNPLPGLWIPRLLRNADFASATCARCILFYEAIPYPEADWRQLILSATATALFPALYYLLRQLVLSYHVPTLQPALRSKLEAFSTEKLHIYDMFGNFVYAHMDDAEQIRQEMHKDKKDWSSVDEVGNPILVKDEWDFAVEIVTDIYWKKRDAEKLLQ